MEVVPVVASRVDAQKRLRVSFVGIVKLCGSTRVSYFWLVQNTDEQVHCGTYMICLVKDTEVIRPESVTNPE